MIESKENAKFKSWMKLKTKKYRDQTSMFLVFGEVLVELAKQKGIVLEIVTTNPNKEGTVITKKLMDLIKTTETSHDVFAVCKKLEQKTDSSNILVLDDVQNPDNVGSILRSALAFGFRHVVLSSGSADVYNDKTIRASSGALFDLFIERLDIHAFISVKQKEGYQAYGADAHKSNEMPKKDKPFILVLGNEGSGLNTETKSLLDGYLNIETKGVESLNVVVAGSILMYEWSKGL